jgi:hypothetical protein
MRRTTPPLPSPTPRESPNDRVRPIAPRLLGRRPSAAYLGQSLPAFDGLRAAGEIPAPIPVPSSRNPSRVSRVPVWDIEDLDLCIARWKSRNGGAR